MLDRTLPAETHLSASLVPSAPEPLATSPAAVVESCPALRRNLSIRGGGGAAGSSSVVGGRKDSRKRHKDEDAHHNISDDRRKMGLFRKASNGNKKQAALSKEETDDTTITAANTKTYPQWHSAVAGAAAGAGSRLLTAPLDLLRIRRQLQLDHPPATSISAAAFTDAIKSAGNKPVGAKAIDAARASAAAAAAESARHPILERFPLLSSLAKIAREEGGVRSLFRGNVAATYLWITYAAVQFSLYSRTSDFISSFAVPSPPPSIPVAPNRAVIGTPGKNDNNGGGIGDATFPLPAPIRHAMSGIASSKTSVAFVAGATAGLAATLTTYPFDLCRTTFAAKGICTTVTDASAKAATNAAATSAGAASASSSGLAPPQSLLGFAKCMYERQGIRGFYAGAGPAAVQIIPYMGINFALYDYFTRTFDSKSVGGAGLAGTIAGGTSKFLVYPMDTIKKRLQAQATIGLNHRQYKNMADCAMSMLKEEGLASFYRGLAPTVLKSCSATGLTFAFFTFTKNMLEATHDSMAASRRKGESRW